MAESVVQLLTEVKKAVGKIAKREQNEQQHFSYRGVDTIVNKVAPALITFGVLTLPHLESERIEAFETTKGSKMFRAVVTVRYEFVGPGGDSIDVTVPGEASDSLDKATSKAMSVAYRTALLQVLSLPTGDPDPDSFSPPAAQSAESSDRSRLAQAKAKVWKLAQDRGWTSDQLADHYRQTTTRVIGEATASLLYAYAKDLESAARREQLPDPPADWQPTP
jgi:hypothetical protein